MYTEEIGLNNVIEIKKLNKSYAVGNEKLHVLKDIDLTVKKGEFLAILGRRARAKAR